MQQRFQGQQRSQPIGRSTTGSRGESSTDRGSRGRQRGSGQPYTQARVFAMTQQEAQATPEVVTGMLFIFSHEARVLIDPGSTHSFISYAFAEYSDRVLEPLEYKLVVATLVGETLLAEYGFNGCGVMVDGYVLEADLILLNIHDFDVILGMDWLAIHRATVDCFRKEITFRKPDIPELVFCGERRVLPSCLMSAMTARKYLRQGCQAYLAHVMVSREMDVDWKIFQWLRTSQMYFLKIFRDYLRKGRSILLLSLCMVRFQFLRPHIGWHP
ncbi:hypothetical protein Pint_10284 [Pistacia integerrima]|uniref:Uncharacterized protein n=1 Tax=Pistacia integerrima TaxID=434235 RepID=A0ACC0XKD1_9ROSI|nr:hypothetical protein Pint_10284 [Pistacia integerrima]